MKRFVALLTICLFWYGVVHAEVRLLGSNDLSWGEGTWLSALGKTVTYINADNVPVAYGTANDSSTDGTPPFSVDDALNAWVDVRAYAGLTAAITAIGSDNATLLIPTSQTLTASLTVPSNVTLMFLGSGGITKASTYTLTINGGLVSSPSRKIFNGFAAGDVKFGVNSVPVVYADWWGAKGDSNMTAGNGTDSTVPIQSALNSGTDDDVAPRSQTMRVVKLLTGKYRVSSAITMPNRTTVEGTGYDSTHLYGNSANINIINFTGQTRNIIKNLTIYNASSGTGTGTGINLASGNTGDLYVENVSFYYLGNGINVASSASWTHGKIMGCQFSYDNLASVNINDSVQLNSILFDSNRFEETTQEHYKASGASTAHGGVKFINNVFESSHAQKAIDLGNNAGPYAFWGNHFENNGIGQTTAYDTYIGNGSRAIKFEEGNYSDMASGVTTGRSIYVDTGAGNISIDTNRFTSTTTGYAPLFVHYAAGAVSLDRNEYPSGATTAQITGNNDGVNPGPFVSRTADGQVGAVDGFISTDAYAFETTTDATQTKLWRYNYIANNQIFYIIADVVATDNSGTNFAAYTRKTLISEATDNVTIQGTDNATTIETNSAWDCLFAVSTDDNGTISLQVVGAAGVTIKWMASIKVISKKWSN